MKTSLTVNLGYQLAQNGHRVLLVDGDPQASLTVFMGIEPADLDHTLADALLRDAPLPIHPNLHGMDLAPANIMLSAAEVQLTSALAREQKLRKVLAPHTDHYDYILLDTPPSLGILSIISLVAATHALVPIQTQYKSYKGTELLLDTIRQVRENVNADLQIAGFVPTLYATANAQDKAILQAITDQLSALAPVFPPIPRATAFADASMAHQPLGVYNPKHPALAALTQIAQALAQLHA